MPTAFHKTVNNGLGYLSTDIDSDDLSITLQTNYGDNFPSSGPFWITINNEILEVSSRTGDVLTISERGSQTTSASSHNEGDVVELRYTSEHLEELQDAVNNLEEGTIVFTNLDVTGTTTLKTTTISGTLSLGSGGVNKMWSTYLKADGYGLHPAVSGGCANPSLTVFRSGRTNAYTLDFDSTTTEVAMFLVALPDDYDGSLLKATIYWTATAGTTGDVRWDLYTAAFTDDSTLDEAGTFGGGAVLDTFLAQKDIHIITRTFTPLNANGGDLLAGYFRRVGNHETDTFDADAKLIGIKIGYNV
jgi:hypothetical protein